MKKRYLNFKERYLSSKGYGGFPGWKVSSMERHTTNNAVY
jgi:hypothetical protein